MASQELQIILRAKADVDKAFGALMGAMKDTQKEAQRTRKTMQESLSAFSSTASSAGLALAPLSLAITGTGVAAVKMAGDFEQTKIAFTTMLGSGRAAEAFLKDLESFAAKTPFEFPELVDSSKRLLAMGFSATSVVPMLTAVGDAVAGLGGGGEMIARVTTALGQMQAKGKVSAEEMMQLAESGIPAWRMLADQIGVSIPKAMSMASDGAIKASTAIPAILAGMTSQFGGMMASQSKTFLGQISTLKDEAGFIARDLGSALMPFAQGAMNVLKGLIPIIREAVSWFAKAPVPLQALGIGFAVVAAAAGPLLLAVGGLTAAWVAALPVLAPMGTAIAGAGAGLLAMVGPVGLVVAGLTALVIAFEGADDIAMVAAAAWDVAKTAALALFEVLGSIAVNVLGAMDAAIRYVSLGFIDFGAALANADMFSDALKLTWVALKSVAVDLGIVALSAKKALMFDGDPLKAETEKSIQSLRDLKLTYSDTANAIVDGTHKQKDATEKGGSAIDEWIEKITGTVKPTKDADAATEKLREEIEKLAKAYREANTAAGIMAEQTKQVAGILQGLGSPVRATATDVQRAITALGEHGDKGRRAANDMMQSWEQANGVMLITSRNQSAVTQSMSGLVQVTGQATQSARAFTITQEQWVAAGDRARQSLGSGLASINFESLRTQGKYVREVFTEIDEKTGKVTESYGHLMERTQDGSGWKIIDEGARRSATAVDALKFALANATGVLEIMGLQGNKALGSIASLAQAAASGDIMGGLAAGAQMSQQGGILGTYASIFTGGGLLSTIGGLFGGGPEKSGKQSIDGLMRSIAAGAKPTADQVGNIADEFARLRGDAAEAGRVGDKAMLDMMRRSRELGVEVPGMAEHIKASLASAATGVGMMVASFGEDKGEGGKFKSGIVAVTAEDAKAQATLFSATFWSNVKENGLIQSADAMREPLTRMRENITTVFGDASTADALMAPITRVMDLTAEGGMFRGAAEGAQGLKMVIDGLANSGYMTRDAFNAAGQQAVSAFDQMVAGGAGANEAILVMAPSIQSAITASEQLGIPLDDNWKRMRQIAEENGVAFRTDPMQAAADAMLEVADALREIIGQADGVAGAIRKIPRETNVRVNYQTTGTPPGGGGGGGGGSSDPDPDDPDVEWNATGNVWSRPTIAGVGEAGPEVAAPVAAVFGRLADIVASRVSEAGGSGGGPVVIHNHVHLDGQEMADFITKATRTRRAIIHPGSVRR